MHVNAPEKSMRVATWACWYGCMMIDGSADNEHGQEKAHRHNTAPTLNNSSPHADLRGARDPPRQRRTCVALKTIKYNQRACSNTLQFYIFQSFFAFSFFLLSHVTTNPIANTCNQVPYLSTPLMGCSHTCHLALQFCRPPIPIASSRAYFY